MHKFGIFSIADGIFQGILLVLLLNYITSTAWSYSASDMPVLIIFAVLSLVGNLVLCLKESNRLWQNYLLRSVFFGCVMLIYFVNQITMHLRLFPIPQRELSDGEGFVILIAVLAFLLLLAIECAIDILRKLRNRKDS